MRLKRDTETGQVSDGRRHRQSKECIPTVEYAKLQCCNSPLRPTLRRGRRADSDDMDVKKNDPEQVISGSSPSLSSVPSFHDPRLRIPYRLFAVLVAYMLQHGTSGLRATAAETVIELVDVLGMWAVKADEDYAARVSVDRVHVAKHTHCAFPPGVIAITFRLPPFGREGAHRTTSRV